MNENHFAHLCLGILGEKCVVSEGIAYYNFNGSFRIVAERTDSINLSVVLGYINNKVSIESWGMFRDVHKQGQTAWLCRKLIAIKKSINKKNYMEVLNELPCAL